MLQWAISFLIAVVTSAAMLIGGNAIIRALDRRGYDPIGAIARFLSPTDVRTGGALPDEA